MALRPFQSLRALPGFGLLPAVALSLGLAAGAVALPAPVQAEEALTPEQAEAVRALVRQTLIDNPEILTEAFDVLKAKQQLEEQNRVKSLISELGEVLTHPEGLPVMGNPDGDITVVEFSDYRCGYCKRVFPGLMEVVEGDGNVRLVVHEYPILGEQSVYAARAALASIPQGDDKYEAFHQALMAHRGDYTEAVVMDVATQVGLDTEQLKADMTDPEIDKSIARGFQLAQALNISGTPAFIVGETFIPGAMGPDALRQFIAEERAKKDG
ncbi:MAG: DsbA family protein [Rhodospirillaceae bacterium]